MTYLAAIVRQLTLLAFYQPDIFPLSQKGLAKLGD